ncbi:SGNH/GDSL hydrolase family protein [Pontibacter beigongshangensis]|uniref:G-D-S-L family lipolytic protein n=1 Tax=Pontibacter beigongshangensis TaxID=2574733 RepID=UPI00165027BE|nr:G-D-S-L family lipolytic protein [Pontibacter beigongshangensis]
MKKFFYKPGMLALAAGIFLASCEPEIDVPTTSPGEADFSTYIAVGNSLTAGYGDRGLYREGQLNSYPAILAQQFRSVGGGEFAQPLFSEEQANGSGYLRLAGLSAQGAPTIVPVTDKLATNQAGRFAKYTGPVQNFGIPDIRLADITTPGYGGAQGNRYFERITPENDANQTYLQRVQAADHTFFSMWLGSNDVLGYATSGGASSDPVYNITPTNTFDVRFSDMVNALTAEGQKGIVATIPNVTSLPFFTTVGASIRQLLGLNPAITRLFAITGAGASRISFAPSQINTPQDGVLIPLTASPYATLVGQPTGLYWRDLAKQVSPSQNALVIRGTLVALLATYQIDTTQMFGLSDRNPLPSALVLDAAEQANVTAATNDYNTIIKSVADAKGLALFDSDAYFKSVASGFSRDGVSYSPAFITGNLFSLDGVHPTPRGYAFIANEMIKAINSKYGARIPTVDETQYRAVLLP